MIESAIFYLFSAVLLASALMVILARNPVHSVLFLILCFFNASGLFLMMGAEFVAFIVMIVYVGAVAVLFLFVVMMLNIDFQEMRRGLMKHLPFGVAVGAVLLFQLLSLAYAWQLPSQDGGMFTAVNPDNTRALGNVLYTKYFFSFQIAGLILLVAMIGAIVLTHRPPHGVRKQDVKKQLNRPVGDVVEVVKIESGKGVL